MQISHLPNIAMSGMQARAPETREGPGPDRDNDADDKAAKLPSAVSTPKGLGALLDSKA